MDPRDVARTWELHAPTWTAQARRGLDVDRGALSTPAFLALLPDVSGLDGLDIGCGEGANTRVLARRSARHRMRGGRRLRWPSWTRASTSPQPSCRRWTCRTPPWRCAKRPAC